MRIEVDYTQPPDATEVAFFSRFDFAMVMEKRVRCSCGKDYQVEYTQGIAANMGECKHHPDWYWMHVLHLSDGRVIVWECCKHLIVEMALNNEIPDELKISWDKPYDDLVRARLNQKEPAWLKEMHNSFFFFDSGFSKKPIRFARPKAA